MAKAKGKIELFSFKDGSLGASPRTMQCVSSNLAFMNKTARSE
jgi:hypothetical protein